jgi:hypothetical protein
MPVENDRGLPMYALITLFVSNQVPSFFIFIYPTFSYFLTFYTSIPNFARQPKSSISRPAARDDKRARRWKRERERER